MSEYSSLLDRPPEPAVKPLLAGLGAVGVHAGLIAVATLLGAGIAREVTKPPLVSQLIEIEAPPPPAPPPAEKPPEPEPTPAPRALSPSAPHDAPAPAAVQAGQVLAAADDVVDFGDSFVVGKGDKYAGGVTEANGAATHAVSDMNARAGGVPGGTGTVVVAVDHSRAPQLAGGSSWGCPFPLEADDAGLDHALVTLRITIAADGHVAQVDVARDPGHGFGREARLCAMRKRWAPGLDHAGSATSAVTSVNVRFDRE